MKELFPVILNDVDLPLDYGEVCASKSMQPLNDLIYDIIHENDEFSDEFIVKIANMENEEFISVDNFDDLFD